ncbi:putative BOI-related E3 ubiquitin-protein ligase 3 isoform X1, partial [Diplonema papillatum]
MGAGGSTGLQPVQRQGRQTRDRKPKKDKKEKKDKREKKGNRDTTGKEKSRKHRKRSRRRRKHEEPPRPVLNAAAAREDIVVLFENDDNEAVTLSRCRCQRLELCIGNEWKRAVSRLTLSQDGRDVLIKSRSHHVAAITWNLRTNSVLLLLARLADLAGIRHNTWQFVRSAAGNDPRCMNCGLQIAATPAFCPEDNKLHPPHLWMEAPTQSSCSRTPTSSDFSWMEATALPSGSEQAGSHHAFDGQAPSEELIEHCKRLDSHFIHVTPSISLLLAITSRLELYFNGVWKCPIGRIELVAPTPSSAPTYILHAFGGGTARVSLEDDKTFKRVTLALGNIADIGSIGHNIWAMADNVATPRVWCCPACLFSNVSTETCKVCGAAQPGLLPGSPPTYREQAGVSNSLDAQPETRPAGLRRAKYASLRGLPCPSNLTVIDKPTSDSEASSNLFDDIADTPQRKVAYVRTASSSSDRTPLRLGSSSAQSKSANDTLLCATSSHWLLPASAAESRAIESRSKKRESLPSSGKSASHQFAGDSLARPAAGLWCNVNDTDSDSCFGDGSSADPADTPQSSPSSQGTPQVCLSSTGHDTGRLLRA